jgi:hypothetical protein
MRAPMRLVWRDWGAAVRFVRKADDAAFDSKSACIRQVLDVDDHRLPDRRGLLIEGAPTLATSSVWRWWLA